MDFDIRLPIGLLFLILGVVLAVHGLTAPHAIFVRHSLGLNVNLGWGVALAVFGAALLAFVAATRSSGE
jgi:hypothetical protein